MVLTTNISTSWVAPHLSSFNFSDCPAATAWAGAAVRVSQNNDLRNDIPLGLTIQYLSSLVPNTWMPPTDTDLAAWYTQVLNSGRYSGDSELNQTLDAMFDYPFHSCNTTICHELGWEGDPDISGMGMIISYYLAASLATVYFLVLVFTTLGLSKYLAPESPKPKKFVSGFQESANTFLDTALIFAVSMLGAAVVRWAKAMGNPQADNSAYSLLGSVMMSAFSVFPALMLQAVTDGQRGHTLRQLLWFIVIALSVTVEILYRTHKSLDSVDDDQATGQQAQFGQEAWSELCEHSDMRKRLVTTLTAGHFVLAVNIIWWLYYRVLCIVPRRWTSTRQERTKLDALWHTFRRWLRVVNGVLCLTVMWLFIYFFDRYRNAVRDLAGRSDDDDEWTFGQVLSLATWAPVLVELVAIYLYGPEKGLSNNLSGRYQVVANRGNEEKKTDEKSMRDEYDSQADDGRGIADV